MPRNKLTVPSQTEYDIDYVDCAVSGGPGGARKVTLILTLAVRP